MADRDENAGQVSRVRAALATAARGRGLVVFRAAVSLALLLGIYVAISEVDPQSWQLPVGRPWLLVPAVLLGLASVGLKAVKWWLVAQRLAPGVTVVQAAASYVGAIPLALVTPGRVGELSRLLFLPQAEIRGAQGVGAVFLDKVTDLTCLLWWLAVGIGLFVGSLELALLAGLAAAVATPVRLWLRALRAGLVLVPTWRGLREKVSAAVIDAELLSVRRLAAVLVVGLLSYAVEWVQYWLVFTALAPQGTSLGLGAVIGAMSLVTLANALQISFAGIGVREGLSVVLFQDLIPGAVAAVGAAAVFLIDQAVPGLVGLAMRPVGRWTAAPP